MRALLSLGVVFLCLSLSLPAWAQEEESVAILTLEISGDGPPELRQQIAKSISEALAGEGLKVTGLDQTLKTLTSVPELIGCSSTACLERIHELIPVKRFVRAVVTASGAHYELHLELLNPVDGEGVVSVVDDSCEVCTISDLNKVAAQAARKLLDPNMQQTLSVKIASNPPGALITINDEEVGEAPVDAKLSVGNHSVRISLEGHKDKEETIEVVADSSEEQRYEYILTKVGKSKEPSAPVDYGAKKWAALGASGALLVLGTVLVVIDGKPDCSSNTAACPGFRKTLTGGIIALSSGVALGALGGWMVWRERQKEPSQSGVSVQLTRGGGIAGYAGSF